MFAVPVGGGFGSVITTYATEENASDSEDDEEGDDSSNSSGNSSRNSSNESSNNSSDETSGNTSSESAGNTSNGSSGNTSNGSSGNTSNESTGNGSSESTGNGSSESTGNTTNGSGGNTSNESSGNTSNESSENTSNGSSGNTSNESTGNGSNESSGNTSNESTGSSSNESSSNASDESTDDSNASTGDGANGSTGTSSNGEGAADNAEGGEGAAPAVTENWPSGIALSGGEESGIVMDVDSGTVLYSCRADVQHYPASITKVMTAMLAIENGNLDDTVTFTKEAVFGIELGSAHIARDVGEEMSLRECLYGTMLASANECAYAVAEHIGGGDYEKFINMMNEKAVELGCKNTHFCNSNGLFDENHYTTAYDMALIARAAYANETFAEICGTKKHTIPPTNIHDEPTDVHNNHAMLSNNKTSKYLYDYCVGGKTGYTTEANNTLVTYGKKDGKTLVCVILNAEQGCHYKDTTNLFDYCFEHFNTYAVNDEMARTRLSSIDGADAFEEGLDKAKIQNNSYVTLPSDVGFSSAHQKVVPLDNGGEGVIGELVFTYAERTVGKASILFNKAEIVQEENVEMPAIVPHRRFEEVVKWFLPVTGGILVFGFLFLITNVYATAPYHNYYGSKLLRLHFRNKRKRQRRKRASRRRASRRNRNR